MSSISKKAKAKKGGSKKKPSYVAHAKPSIGLPVNLHVIGHAAHLYSSADSSDKLITVNDAFSPFGVSINDQFFHYDQYAEMYNTCMVTKCRYAVSVFNASTDCVGLIVAVPAIDNGAWVSGASNTLLVRPNSKSGYITDNNYLNIPVKNPILSGQIIVKDYYQYKDWQDSNELCHPTGSSAGLVPLYLHIINKTGATLDMMVELWQTTVFWEPSAVAAS